MNSMSALSYLGSIFAPMANCSEELPEVKSTCFVSLADLNLSRGSDSVVGFFRDVLSDGSTLSL